MRAAAAIAAVLAAGATGAIALAADARLDPTFAGTGKVTIDLGGAERAEALLLQPDGKILVAGSSSAGTSAAFLERLNADGSPDPTFDGDGRLMLDATGVDQVPALAQQPDGRLLVAWQTLTTTGETVTYRVRLLRLNADGSPDTSFAAGGTNELFTGGAPGLQGGGPAGAQAIAPQPDGRTIVLLATALYGLAPDGSTEWRSSLAGPGLVFESHALATTPGGRILVAGALATSGSTDAFVGAFHPGGSFDTSFGINSGVTFGKGAAQALAVLPDGRLSVATRTAVVRLTADGAPAGTQAVAGGITALATDAQGRIVVAAGGAVTRLTTALAPDPTFGAGGTAGLGAAAPAALAVQADGKLVVAATEGTDAAVLRLPANAPVRPPAAKITRHPASTLHARSARVTFAFRADTAGARFGCALDAAAFKPCRSPAAYVVRGGAHAFRVRATSGGVNGPAATFRFRVVAPR